VYQKTLLHKLLISLTKISLLVCFGSDWYRNWYRSRLSIPSLPFAVRHGMVVLLDGWYALGDRDD
jgi:hypothetical protein